MKRAIPVESEQQQARHSDAAVQNQAYSNAWHHPVDNRAETIAQRQLMADINASPRMAAQRRLAEAIDSSPVMAMQRKQFAAVQQIAEEAPLLGRFEPVQRMVEEEPLQGQFDPAQRVEDEELLQGKLISADTMQPKAQTPAKPNHTGLPDNLKSGIELHSGL